MQPRTRDNLIYLSVGISIAALVVLDVFYSESHGREAWMPSRFAFRVPIYMALLGYFVARETRKVNATLVQTAICVIVASILHLGVAFAFRGTFSGPRSLGLAILVPLEIFGIVVLMVQVVRYLSRRSHRA